MNAARCSRRALAGACIALALAFGAVDTAAATEPRRGSKSGDQGRAPAARMRSGSRARDALPPIPPSCAAPYPQGRYKLAEALGGGAVLSVRRAIDTATNRSVVVKRPRQPSMGAQQMRLWIPKAGQSHLLTEVRIMDQIAPHPNVAHPIACYTAYERNQPYNQRWGIGDARVVLVYEQAEFGDLSALLLSSEFTSSSEHACAVRATMHQVMLGLRHLEASGIVHRDLRPSVGFDLCHAFAPPYNPTPRIPTTLPGYHQTPHHPTTPPTSSNLAPPSPPRHTQNVLISFRGSGAITAESLVAKLTDMGNGCELGSCTTPLGGRKGLTAPEAGMQFGRPGSVRWVATESDVRQPLQPSPSPSRHLCARRNVPRLEALQQYP